MRSSNLPTRPNGADESNVAGAAVPIAADHGRSKSADIRTRQRLVLSDDDRVSESSVCGLEGIYRRLRTKPALGDTRLACDFDRKIPPAVSVPAKHLCVNPRDVMRSQRTDDFIPLDSGTTKNTSAIRRADVAQGYNTMDRRNREHEGGMKNLTLNNNYATDEASNRYYYGDFANVPRVQTYGKHFVQTAAPTRTLDKQPSMGLYNFGATSLGLTQTLHDECRKSTCCCTAQYSASEESESEEYDSWEIYGNDNEGVRYEGAFNSSRHTADSEPASPASEYESSPSHVGQEKDVGDANYESRSSASCGSSCCEECNNNICIRKSYENDEPEHDPTGGLDAGDGSYSEESSSTPESDKESASSATGSSRKHESVKRSSRALDDEREDDSTRYGAYSIKRFRSSEGLAVLPPTLGADRYKSDSSLSGDSPLAASSCVTKHVPSHDEHSPAPGEEAGTASREADRPGSSVEAPYSDMVGADFQWRKYEGAFAYSTFGGAHAGVCGAFRHYDDPLPFQLHPAHHDDLEDYFYFMREREVVSHPSYCLQGQQKIKSTMRRILVEWLTMIAHHYKLNGETIHLTVNILDRYTERQQGIYRGHYQLLGVTSLLVASKQLEVDIPPVSTCLMLCRNLYSKAQMLSLERHLLDILYFDFNVPTAHTFLDYYIIRAYYDITKGSASGHYYRDDTSNLKSILCVARRLLDTGLADYEFSQYLPSIAAKAAMELAEAIVTEPDPSRPFHRVLREATRHRYLLRADGSSLGDETRYPNWRRPANLASHELQRSHKDLRYSSYFSTVNCTNVVGLRSHCNRSAPRVLTDLDPDEVQESILALTALVGEREIRTIQLMINKIVSKYSFE